MPQYILQNQIAALSLSQENADRLTAAATIIEGLEVRLNDLADNGLVGAALEEVPVAYADGSKSLSEALAGTITDAATEAKLGRLRHICELRIAAAVSEIADVCDLERQNWITECERLLHESEAADAATDEGLRSATTDELYALLERAVADYAARTELRTLSDLSRLQAATS